MRSLKVQIIFSLSILTGALLTQVYFSRSSQTLLIENQNLAKTHATKLEVVHELERDVIDLQRIVLIFKETASASSASKFKDLVESVTSKIEILQAGLSTSPQKSDLATRIDRMKLHLQDYEDNFSTVMTGRKLRKEIFEKVLTIELQAAFNKISLYEKNNKNKQNKQSILLIRYYLSEAKSYPYQYSRSPDSELIEKFHRSIAKASTLSKNTFKNNEIQSHIISFEKAFISLRQTTRGYMFLVNVVMAGSANEILYLTSEIKDLVRMETTVIKEEVEEEAALSIIKSDTVSVLCGMVVFLLALFLLGRIINPIGDITTIFRRLAKDEEVNDIPGQKRKDEIGNLAQAASIFHKKNKLTSSLLKEAQEMNTLQEELNEKLEYEKKKSEHAAESKAAFLANMSHEIRTPMNGIIGLVELTKKTKLNKKQRNYLEKISFSSHIMMGVINDILDFSKIEAGKLEVEEVEFSLQPIIDNVISSTYLGADEKTLNFRVNTLSTIPKTLLGDPLRISQVVLNLCTNAIKFTKAGSIHVNFEFNKSENKSMGELTISVKDTGIGITLEQQKSIFEKFTQADQSTSRKFGGTGLGLSIVKQLSALMGGGVSVYSVVGEGSEFIATFKVKSNSEETLMSNLSKEEFSVVYFKGSDSLLDKQFIDTCEFDVIEQPYDQLANAADAYSENEIILIDVTSEKHMNAIAETLDSLVAHNANVGIIIDMQPNVLKANIVHKWGIPVLAHPFSPKDFMAFARGILQVEEAQSMSEIQVTKQYTGRVLLVEDNTINQLVAGDMLEDLGVDYDIADDGQLAIDMIKNEDIYDLILMDIQMPVKDGYTATVELREKGFNTLPICGLSANALKSDFEKAESIGMDGYLTKPLNESSLEAIIDKFLSIKDAE